jgi:hypothetical protein
MTALARQSHAQLITSMAGIEGARDQRWGSITHRVRAASDESAPVVARLAALARAAEKRQAVQAVARQDGERFAEEYVETIERRYIDQLSLNVIEMRLRKN